jgi:hypothetical protein
VHVVPAHRLEAAGGDDGVVEGEIRPVHDGRGHVSGFAGDRGEERGGGEGDGVALVGADEVACWIGFVFAGWVAWEMVSLG